MPELQIREHGWRMLSSAHGFLEAPRWFSGYLYASDFISREVIRFSPDGGHEVVVEVEDTPSGLGLLPDGGMLVVSSEERRVLLHQPDGGVEIYADFAHIAGGKGNDMLVTEAGHCYVGNFGFWPGQEEFKPAQLIHVDPERRVNQEAGDLLFPNGMALHGESLIVAETYGNRLTAFRIGDDGALLEPRIWAQLGEDQRPDGIALDSDGGIWYANTHQTSRDRSGFFRVEEGGRVTDRIPIDGAWAVACAFGGQDLSELYITCAFTSREDFYAGKSSSFVGRANVGRRGVPGSQ